MSEDDKMDPVAASVDLVDSCAAPHWPCTPWLCRCVEKVVEKFAKFKTDEDYCLCCEIMRHWLFGYIAGTLLITVPLGVIYVLLRKI